MAVRTNNNNGGIAIDGIPTMVQQNFAQTHPGFQTNFEGMKQPDVWTEQGKPVTAQPVQAVPPMNFFGQGGKIHGAYDPAPKVASPAPENGAIGVQVTNPAATQRNDLGSLSQALSRVGVAQQNRPQFQKDATSRDGGFFKWLGGLIPKKRKGLREGETPDEYDARMTRNSQMYFTLADAVRHIGNIINTSNGAPVQQFNDPNTMLEQGYQQRKAARQQQAAQEADAAYKQANLSLKERAAEAERAYKQMDLGFKKQAADRAVANDEFNRQYKTAGLNRQIVNDEFNRKLGAAKFEESQRHNKVSESQGAVRIALSQERNGIARARLAHTISTNGGNTSMTNLSSPTGHMNRKKDLNPIEKKQLAQYLIKNGYINKKNLDAYNNYSNLSDTKGMGNLVNYWIVYAANMDGKKGDSFRSLLRDHYMYQETSTTSTPATKGSVVTITHNNNKGKTASKPAAKTGKKFHVN